MSSTSTERYFEDYAPGAVFEFGEIAVTAEEIVAFATRYDPQPMHTDPAAAASGAFGGLIASGWHTAALAIRPPNAPAAAAAGSVCIGCGS